MEKRIIFCECFSPEHQVIFIHDKEEASVYMETHLITYKNFWKRLWVGLKYAFGYKCRFGNFDSLILGPNEIKELDELVKSYYNSHPEKSEKIL